MDRAREGLEHTLRELERRGGSAFVASSMRVGLEIVDRLLHHAHVIVTEGQSHRLTEALGGRGVSPLEAADPE